ncbi:class I SAM-dependent methyltransferase [Glycomyces tritici]|uniref:Class I SAM-dependent methyltransferase n=1 Tax=Glycomyces tritici TaxID=2665176 RepID=A0ABT7YIL6_9ACTN|nr:class I SAM-dependent methyltransferase [Glycomyces tritici]MDN3238098.1 class I SAM-dependent methyltransferase [Glycomyces tritici]
MQRERLDLAPIQETLLLTLYARALDSRGERPILGDEWSADLANRIDYDFAKLDVKPGLICGTALRAKRIDEAVANFTAYHPNAVVMDLGCGLDTRVLRCDPPPGVTWYDVDFPEIIAVRERLVPSPSVHIGADLTETGWHTGLPADRPAIIVAEGLLPFMPGDSFQQMIRTLTAHFTTGELVLNGYTRFAAWAMKYHPTIKAIGITAAQGFDDPREPQTWEAGLTLAEELMLARAPEVADFPQPLRALSRVMGLSTGLSRQGTRILRYRF